MDERVAFIKHRIRAVVIAGDCDQITYQSEWLGYMPFPVDHWG